MNQSAKAPSNPHSIAPRPHRFVRRLTLLYAGAALIVVLSLSVKLLPENLLPGAHAFASEVQSGGLGGMVLSALLLALTGLLATLALTQARYRGLLLRFDAGFAAREAQALIVSIGAMLTCLSAALLWPAWPFSAVPANANAAAAFAFTLAFVSLVAERAMHAFPAPQLPEAPSLRRLLLLSTVLLLAAACAELGRGSNLEWIRWPVFLLICLPGVVAAELAIRALARLFLPAPAAASAKAVTDSIVASLLTGGPRAPGTLLRTHLGLDFARSWALSYLNAALLPAIAATALLCWGLSGLKLIDLGQRGIYERFGAPVAVLGPGLHVLLPWPLGRLRPVEYGTIHAAAIGVGSAQDGGEDSVAAEALPPASLNRLWESSHPGQAEYLVASLSTGLQGFQTVSTEIKVLYRVGLTDAAALQSVYSVAEPQTLVEEAASRLVLRYFSSRTLEEVLGARRENIADSLRDALVRDLNARHAGIDIVSVLIEEIHPPAGAAAAYHAVQAAQINATASISNEIGRAKRIVGVAQQESHQLVAASSAKAEETLRAANTDAYQFNADRRAYAEAGRAFLFERSNHDIVAALVQTPLTIMDHRLSAAQAPIMDLRALGGAASNAAAPASSSAAPASIAPGSAAPASGTATPDALTPEVESDN
jgi:regulator of protease activity HflC (stomatin/prohibitin superfamily)